MEDGQAFDFTQRDDEIVTNGGTLDQIASFAVDGSDRLYAIGLDGEIFRLTPTDDFGAVPPPQEHDGRRRSDWEEVAAGGRRRRWE